MALSPRFQLDDILGNEVVDFQVLQANNDKLDAGAAGLTLANTYTNVQTIQRPAVGNPALQTRVTGDASPRLTITADGVIQWASASVTAVGGALTVGGTTLTVPSVQAAAGTAAAPGYTFSTDTNTGFFSPSGDILGVAVGGVETNRINNQGEIRFNRTNARIADRGSDDPSTPGERLVAINALEVTPGRLHASGGASLSTLTVNGASQQTGAVNMGSTLTVAGQIQTSGPIKAYGGLIHFEGSNVVNIQWRGDLGALYIPYGNGIYTSHGRFTGNVAVDGQINAGRLIVGAYDAGWTGNFAANVITNGRFYQRGNGGYHCWDAGDFAYNIGAYGNQLVQRDAGGSIQVNGVYLPTAAQGGQPAYVLGQTGDGWQRWWPRSAVGAPSLWQARLTCAGAGGKVTSGAVTLPYSGYYFAVAGAKGGEYSPGWQLAVEMVVGGGVYYENYGSGDKPGHPQWDDSFVRVYMTCEYRGAGTQAYFSTFNAYNDQGDRQNEMYIVFVPSAQYPG